MIDESVEEVRLFLYYLVCTYAAPAAVIKYISCTKKLISLSVHPLSYLCNTIVW